MPRKPSFRVVSSDEKPPAPPKPPTLLEAVESGDVLEIMLAQRRIIAESMMSAADNTRPQYSNELNKLNALIAAEQARRTIAAEDDGVIAHTDDEDWDESAI